MANAGKLINPTLDEGIGGNIRDLQMAMVRASVRKMIETTSGRPDWSKANNVAMKHQMCAATVIKFAYGDTRRPSTWTIKHMSMEVGFQLVLVPLDAKLPAGSLQLE